MKHSISPLPYLALILVPISILAVHQYKPIMNQTAKDLGVIEQQVITQTEATGQLPANWNALKLPDDVLSRTKAASYTYRAIPPVSYELCATFPSSGGSTSNHETGPIGYFGNTTKHQCFTGESLRLESLRRATAGQNPICESNQASPSAKENSIDSTYIGTLKAIQDNQLSITENNYTGSNICPYGEARMPDGKIVPIKSLAPGTHIKVNMNISSYVLLVNVLDPKTIPAALQKCFGSADKQHYADGFYYDLRIAPPLVVMEKNLTEHWIKFRDPQGVTLKGYWCNTMRVRAEHLATSEIDVRDLIAGQTVFDPDFR